ncbi:MAG: hypothetical protein ABFR53_05380 [Actinomycetota bacterium]
MRRWVVVVTVAALVLTVFAPAAMAVPAAGNEDKLFVEEFYAEYEWDCGDGVYLDAVWSGWMKGRVFAETSNSIELLVWHTDTVFTNESGDTWVWKDRGPDHVMIKNNADGVPTVYVTVTGRSALNIIGHMVINAETGEIEFVAGQQPFGGEPFEYWPEDLACEVLG